MLKKATMILLGCVVATTPVMSAHAEQFDFDPGIGPDIFNPNFASGDGHPYDWYYQGIDLNYTAGYTDGSDANAPYFIFDGTDKSSAGHCLQIVFNGDRNATHSPYPVERLKFSFFDSAGHDSQITEVNTKVGGYNIVRIWLKNTGSGLYWHTKITDLDGANGSWNQRASMNIWRLDLSKASCTDQFVNTPVVAISIIGVTGNYNVCRISDGVCTPGG